MTQCNIIITQNLIHDSPKSKILKRFIIKNRMSAGPTNSQILVHEVGQSVAWEILLNVSIILALLKYSGSAAFLHMVIGICMFFMTYFFVLWYLIPFGFIQSQEAVLVYYIHAIIGCGMLGFIVLLVGSGLFTRYSVDSVFGKKLRFFVKKFHILFAYAIIILFKINILYNWYTTNMTTFTVLTAWDVTTFLIWAYLKFFSERIQSSVLDMRVKIGPKKMVPEVTSVSEVQTLKHPYVIYNGYGYDASKLVNHHPGGQKVINTILGREVDRFLYGMYSSELCPEVQSHSHSTGVLTLLKEPVFKIGIPPPFKDFPDGMMGVKVQFMNEVSKKTRIYVLGLVTARGEFQFAGYTDVRQLGQYYSLTMDQNITRLYTAANFLNRHNILLLSELIPTLKYSIEDKKSWRSKKSDFTELKELHRKKEDKLIRDDEVEMKQYLPIMIKIYENGKFTSKLQKMDLSKAKLQLSPPKGFGLELDVTKPGRIVIVAGGTGLFPFSDLIDLLYKSVFLEKVKTHRQEILQTSPVLRSAPFKKYTFVMLIAINQSEDLHPITHHQLAFLSRHPSTFKVVLRVNSKSEELKSLESSIEFTRDYFTNRVVTEASVENFSRVWICGPPKMCTDVANSLLTSGYSRDSFLLV